MTCDTENGYVRSGLIKCCKVDNCDTCNIEDGSLCEKCTKGYFLLSKSDTKEPTDRCINESTCNDVFKMQTNGLYAKIDHQNLRWGTVVPSCLPCKRNCMQCSVDEPTSCQQCKEQMGINDVHTVKGYKASRREGELWLNENGQCCPVQYCRDCSNNEGYTHAELRDKNPKSMEDLC
jgi:hypothetical protein